MTQSDVAISLSNFNPIIVDNETEDNELYYQMVQEEKEILLSLDRNITHEEAEIKREYVNSLFVAE